MTTQCERILAYMKCGGALTQVTGYQRFGTTCTSQRITDLRKRGYNILTRYERSPSGARYAVWSLGGKKK